MNEVSLIIFLFSKNLAIFYFGFICFSSSSSKHYESITLKYLNLSSFFNIYAEQMVFKLISYIIFNLV